MCQSFKIQKLNMLNISNVNCKTLWFIWRKPSVWLFSMIQAMDLSLVGVIFYQIAVSSSILKEMFLEAISNIKNPVLFKLGISLHLLKWRHVTIYKYMHSMLQNFRTAFDFFYSTFCPLQHIDSLIFKITIAIK